jgi:cytochrome d ubiquinol oxidase subunit II
MYVINTVDNQELITRSRKSLLINGLPFFLFFLFFVVSLLISKGYAVDQMTGTVSMEKFKYLHNFIHMPVALILFLAGVIGVLYGFGISAFTRSLKGIWFSGAGTILAVISLFFVAGFNSTSFYPSFFNLQSSLTIRNASSSQFTLKTMMYVSFIIPFVLAYIWYAWKSINNKRITEEEMKSDGHVY